MPDERIETKAANVAPLLFTPEQAAKVLACGRTTIFVAIADGRIRATKLGRSTRALKKKKPAGPTPAG